MLEEFLIQSKAPESSPAAGERETEDAEGVHKSRQTFQEAKGTWLRSHQAGPRASGLSPAQSSALFLSSSSNLETEAWTPMDVSQEGSGWVGVGFFPPLVARENISAYNPNSNSLTMY